MSESEERPLLDIHRNSHGAKIFKCCSSCGHKSINAFGYRICKVHNKKVERYYICKRWMLAIGLERAGAGGGEVDLHCYEKFIKRMEDNTIRENLLKDAIKKVLNEKGEQETISNQ